MIRSITKYARTPLLVLAGAGLLSGCAEIKSGMNRIQDSISSLGATDQAQSETADTNQTSQKQQQQQKSANSPKKDGLECPDIKIIDALSTVHKFTDMNPPREDKRVSTARLMSLEHECRITDQGKGQVDLYMTFETTTGPASKSANHRTQDIGYPYFVAVTDKTGAILSKDVFELSITPSSNTGVITARENIRQIIPVDSPQDLRNYSIAIGFQMSDAQLEYNRKNIGDKQLDKPESITPEKNHKAGTDAHKQIRNMGQ